MTRSISLSAMYASGGNVHYCPLCHSTPLTLRGLCPVPEYRPTSAVGLDRCAYPICWPRLLTYCGERVPEPRFRLRFIPPPAYGVCPPWFDMPEVKTGRWAGKEPETLDVMDEVEYVRWRPKSGFWLIPGDPRPPTGGDCGIGVVAGGDFFWPCAASFKRNSTNRSEKDYGNPISLLSYRFPNIRTSLYLSCSSCVLPCPGPASLSFLRADEPFLAPGVVDPPTR